MNIFSNIRVLPITANIAAGKSTLLERVKKAIGDSDLIMFVPEPTKEWEETYCADGSNILQKYYSDPKGWSFKFQLVASRTRTESLERACITNPKVKVIVVERSKNDDRFIFAEKLKDDGFIDEDELMLLDMDRKSSASKLDYAVKNVIHLKTSVATCLERRLKRKRSGEEGVGIDLLASLLKKEEEYINRLVQERGPNYVIELDGNLENDTDEYDQMVFKLANYILSIAYKNDQ
jgi:deoxyadenosine/deoxycytidine kinase